jgi:hypothetical protein
MRQIDYRTVAENQSLIDGGFALLELRWLRFCGVGSGVSRQLHTDRAYNFR